MRLLPAVLSVLLPMAASAAVIDLPADGGSAAGIGFISGWKCAMTEITVSVDGGPMLPAAEEFARGDTDVACGDTLNGWMLQFNFGLAGTGVHTVKAYDDGVEFASNPFTVAAFADTFLRDKERQSHLTGFPEPEQRSRLEWSQANQDFVVTDICGVGTPTGPCQPPLCTGSCDV